MNNREMITKQQVDDILHVLEDTIENGPWQKSNFLTAVGRNLQDIRTNFAELAEKTYGKGRNYGHSTRQMAMERNMKEIFISLYSVDVELSSWERILTNLPKQNVFRPIYAAEEDVQLLIKSKEKKINEAYVSVYIGQDDVINMDSTKVIVDKLGKSLLSLKGKAVQISNYHYFVYDGVHYKFIDGRLVKKHKD